MKHISIFRKKPVSKQRGFSLIEVLISIIVMTFGLLGISGLMMKGVSNSTGSELASRASQSASEIMDAMRANPTNASTYLTNFGTNPNSLTGTTPSETDRKQWLEALQRLPGGDGEIKADTTTTDTNDYIVTVRFANCIGTLSDAEKTKCATATNNSDKAEIIFKFKI